MTGYTYAQAYIVSIADLLLLRVVPVGEANALQFALNRPFVPATQTLATGKWNWVGLPQAVLFNGKGFFGDCDLVGGLPVGAGVAEENPPCNVTTAVVAPGDHHTMHTTRTCVCAYVPAYVRARVCK